jgi:hypothetical protein
MSEDTKSMEQNEVTTNGSDKKCFVIMPISEIDTYGPGHFKRVYEYIIKPACLKAGFIPIRADEVQQTNVIVIDILKKIIESDMVICDLSSKNPNVFYELGIRQAFGLPTVLIKDYSTGRVFDISSLRDFEYDENLRIDKVNEAVETISELLINTYQSYEGGAGDINSLISLLNIPAAKKPQEISITDDTRLILESIEAMGKRISKVEDKVRVSNSNDMGLYSKVKLNTDTTKFVSFDDNNRVFFTTNFDPIAATSVGSFIKNVAPTDNKGSKK